MCKSAKNNAGIAALGGEHRYSVVHHHLPQLRPCLNRWVAFLANPILEKTPHRKIPPQSFLWPLCFHLDSCQGLSKQERKIKFRHDFCCFPAAFQGIDVVFQAAQKCQQAGDKGARLAGDTAPAVPGTWSNLFRDSRARCSSRKRPQGIQQELEIGLNYRSLCD